MGQKSNPILLRLEKTNQQWISCWYNDHNYAAQFLDDYVVCTYIQNCSQQLKKIPPFFFIKRYRGQMQISLFFSRLAPRAFPFGINRRRNSRVRLLGKTNSLLLSNHVKSRGLIPIAPFVQKEGNEFQKNLIEEKARVLKEGVLLGSVSCFSHTIVSSQLDCKMDKRIPLFHSDIRLSSLKMGSSIFYKMLSSTVKSFYQNARSAHRPTNLAQVGGRQVKTPLKTHLEDSICAGLGLQCKLYLLKCPSIHQNPLFLTSQIVNLLQERISFRQFKHRLINQCSQDATIKGIRIMCSGRAAARSKKAQKARRESIQWGETGLNVFSELVHFASKKAQTTFGTIGVKVWICYKKGEHGTLFLGL